MFTTKGDLSLACPLNNNFALGCHDN